MALAIGALLLGYIALADRFMPITPEARALSGVTRIAPEVSGRVLAVSVANNQPVSAGQPLFRIDPLAYRQAVAAAELAVQQAIQDNGERDAAVAQAQAAVASAQSAADDAARQAERLQALARQRYVALGQAQTALAERDAAMAALRSARAQLQAARVQRGAPGEANLALRTAGNSLDIARRDLDRTQVRAPQDGVVANLQLRPGDYAQAGQSVLALVGRNPVVAADFREKTLAGVHVGDRALVVFDGRPGQVYVGRVASIDAGIAQGQLDADGALVETVETDRWIRRAERMRVNVRLDQAPHLPSGARATVQLVPTGGLAALLARVQIRLASWVAYVY
ncbi:HlyD family secretion protein [Xanthomonas massiliensis]|uniref:HlyD family secretion protein n=1 Tax=Xanthomonas massiliensis TaxID=1720302 RepID=UPI0008261670|nr:HlyD family secretion protein [Xanthomonas massiliensis]